MCARASVPVCVRVRVCVCACVHMCLHVCAHVCALIVCVCLHAHACCRQGERLPGRYGTVGPEKGWRVPCDPLHPRPTRLSLVEIPMQGWAEARSTETSAVPREARPFRVLELRPAFERPGGAGV